MKARDAIRALPVMISATATIAEAATLMKEQTVGALLVVDGDALVGILTDRDIVVRAVARSLPFTSPVETVMTRQPVTVDADEELTKVLNTFYREPFRRLPVLDGQTVVGIVTVDEMLVRMVNDLDSLIRPVYGQVVFATAAPDEATGPDLDYVNEGIEALRELGMR